jgi:hypothetical protein
LYEREFAYDLCNVPHLKTKQTLLVLKLANENIAERFGNSGDGTLRSSEQVSPSGVNCLYLFKHPLNFCFPDI